MTEDRKRAKELEAALQGDARNEETQPLVDTAERLRRTLAVDVPPADRQRALFLSGIEARRHVRLSPLRLAVPALAIAVVVFAVIAGRHALPGEQLYPFREALNAVGIGESPIAEVDTHLNEAWRLVKQADEIVDTNPERALSLAIRGLEELGPARELVAELNAERAEEKLDQIEDVEDDALDTIEDALDARADAVEAEEERSEDARDDSGSSDDSGSGSDDSGSDDSGSGSDDSGSGSDDSGSGSDDSGSGGDDSGSGSDDSGSDDSGSDSGSGGDDSGSSGSGSDDSGGSGGDD